MLARKNRRTLRIANDVFFWAANCNDGWLDLVVMTNVPSTPKLLCKFEYESPRSGQFAITPSVVRTIIEHARERGWKPFERGDDLDLHHVDDVISQRTV